MRDLQEHAARETTCWQPGDCNACRQMYSDHATADFDGLGMHDSAMGSLQQRPHQCPFGTTKPRSSATQVSEEESPRKSHCAKAPNKWEAPSRRSALLAPANFGGLGPSLALQHSQQARAVGDLIGRESRRGHEPLEARGCLLAV